MYKVRPKDIRTHSWLHSLGPIIHSFEKMPSTKFVIVLVEGIMEDKYGWCQHYKLWPIFIVTHFYCDPFLLWPFFRLTLKIRTRSWSHSLGPIHSFEKMPSTKFVVVLVEEKLEDKYGLCQCSIKVFLRYPKHKAMIQRKWLCHQLNPRRKKGKKNFNFADMFLFK